LSAATPLAIRFRSEATRLERKYDRQNLLCFDTRRDFDLTAHAVIRCLAKVADAYATQTANPHDGAIKFGNYVAQPYEHPHARRLPEGPVRER
jgi:hypothetical protein